MFYVGVQLYSQRYNCNYCHAGAVGYTTGDLVPEIMKFAVGAHFSNEAAA